MINNLCKSCGNDNEGCECRSVGIAKKVAHVRTARQERNHKCHWPRCDVQVPPAKWGCTKHWYMLPREIRAEIWRTYSVGQENTMTPSRSYMEASRKAQDWIRKNA